MGKPTGFKEYPRETPRRRPVELRILDYNEVYQPMPDEKLRQQGARCMDCGVPFCHGPSGCPLGNIIPEWNDRVYRDRWRDALELLLKTNNFPEFTGRVCPAPCEEACTLNINSTPVTIKLIEQNIIEHAFEQGWIHPQPPSRRTGKKVAVVGSGPAGLAAAAQLNKAGHLVTVFERADRIGGLLTYGIPNFKLEKRIVDRRVDLMTAEGINFITGANVGVNTPLDKLRIDFDAIILCGGATAPRDLKVPGRELDGIHFAMDFLPQQNKRDHGDTPADPISAAGKHVIIIGGGDTGADCLGTSLRQGAKSIRQFELMPKPPEARAGDMPWPIWPMVHRVSSAHEEADGKFGADPRDFAINTQRFTGDADGNVRKLHGFRLQWEMSGSRPLKFTPVPDSEFELDCDLCLLAMGFVGPEHPGPIEQLGLECDPRGNVKVDDRYESSVPGIFAAGDIRRGQSLVVWAISEGRQAARAVDESLMGRSDLPKMKLF